MYQIKDPSQTTSGLLELSNDQQVVLIDATQGGRIHSWHSQQVEVISNVDPLTYQDTYAGAVLFPFANRIEDGVYRFRESEYHLNINEKSNNCALHGLTYNKQFEILQSQATHENATVTLRYQTKFPDIGFPYFYAIKLIYLLHDKGLSLKVEVENQDSKAFPFTIGWHPYFKSSNLKSSQLIFDSSTKIETDSRLITTSVATHYKRVMESLEAVDLDDCYGLQDDPIVFDTPQYELTITSTDRYKYLQFYTPPVSDTIAIEPVTGISNSFNNSHGLQVLDAGKDYSITWDLLLTHKIN